MRSEWYADTPAGRVTVTADGALSGPASVVDRVARALLVGSVLVTPTGPLLKSDDPRAVAALLAQFPDVEFGPGAPNLAPLLEIPEGAWA